MKKPAHQSQPPRGPDPLVAAAEAMPVKARRKGRNSHTRYGNTKGNGDYETRAWQWEQEWKKANRHHSTSSS